MAEALGSTIGASQNSFVVSGYVNKPYGARLVTSPWQGCWTWAIMLDMREFESRQFMLGLTRQDRISGECQWD